jgi:hypothetical protein
MALRLDMPNERMTEEAGFQHGGAVATGAVVGTFAAAVVAGSLVLVIMLMLGAVLGGTIAGIVAMLRDAAGH